MTQATYEKDPFKAGDPVRMYLDDIGRHPLLNREEERETATAYIIGNQAAVQLDEIFEKDPYADIEDESNIALLDLTEKGRLANEKMINSNLRLVVSIAKRSLGNGLDLLDLIQEGNSGLFKAVEKFDPDKGFKFSTYATWWIRQSITRGYQNKGSAIRVPNQVQSIHNQISQAANELLNNHAEPTDEAIAEFLGWKPGVVKKARRTIEIQKIKYLNEEKGDDDGFTLEDMVIDLNAKSIGEIVIKETLKREIDTAFEEAGLDDRERFVIEQRFGMNLTEENHTLQEVANSLKPPVSRERVRQIERTALNKLREVEWLRELLTN
ncbi:MAG: sigma-70 family RNA polymerase sigma factor [Candidatus Saccharibacteria bacterium]|nr:sigma-70 family RNA polymerase sigma factor [Candidatus Saccharibacteria bacterium]